MTLEQGTTTSCHLDFADPDPVLELEIHFEEGTPESDDESSTPLGDCLVATAKRVLDLEAELEEEKTRRAEAQGKLEELEDRYERFVRERSALDQSARTLHDRFRARTERLYASLLRREGGIGAQVADATRELMEASEHLIRLQADRDSLIRQVEKLRLALHRERGLTGEKEILVDKDDETLTLLQTFKGDIERRLASFTRGLEDRLDALSGRLVAPPAAPAASFDFAAATGRFYADGPLAEACSPPVELPPVVADLDALDRISDQVQASPEPFEPVSTLEAVAPPAAAVEAPVVEAPPAEPLAVVPEPKTEAFARCLARVGPAAPGMERILETRRLARLTSTRLAALRAVSLDAETAHVVEPPRATPETVKREPRPAPAAPAHGMVASVGDAISSSRLGLTLVAGSVAGVVVSLMIATSSLGERSFGTARADAAVAPTTSETLATSRESE
jgi:hypothetical protein